MKKCLILLLVLFVLACNSSHDDYNADKALSSYKALPADVYRMVECIRMDTVDNKGREYNWEYRFEYDAHNRIKNIHGNIVRHVINPNNKRMYKKRVTFDNYYFYTKNNGLRIEYHAQIEFPEFAEWNDYVKYSFYGLFNNDGTILSFGPFECEYSYATLNKAYFDNGNIYTLLRDRYGNVTGWSYIDAEERGESNEGLYRYTEYINNTNIDISGLLGYWIIERDVAGNEVALEPMFQLATFDMLGIRSINLPEAVWEFDSAGYPISAKLPTGMRLTIEYLE